MGALPTKDGVGVLLTVFFVADEEPMPIQIKELHIRVAVDARSAQQATVARAVSGEIGGSGADKDAIVAECVEQVLEIMQSKKDR